MADRWMYRIIYLSTAARQITPEDLESILSHAQINNARDGVTGLLMFHDNNFLQFLEGEQAAVMACVKRIEANTMHRQIMRVFAGEVDQRLFAEWSMAFARPATTLPNAPGVRAFDAVRALLPDIERGDRRVAIMIRNFFSSFRDVG